MAKRAERSTGARAYSEETVLAKTGRPSGEWFAILDVFDAATRGHTAAARHLREAHGLPGWWAQMVTVRYEWARGLRGATPVPDDLRRALAADPASRGAFAALTPYQQSRTAEWIVAAKRAETRVRRLERTLAALRAGKPPVL